MKIILPTLISLVLIIDFIKLDKTSKNIVFIYISIVVLIISVSTIDYFNLIKKSPIEAWVTMLNPITQWIKGKLH